MAIPQHVHPVIKNKPPIGVIGPTQEPTLNGNMVLVESKYKEPLKSIIPIVIAVAALFIHCIAIAACSYFFAFDMDKPNTIKLTA